MKKIALITHSYHKFTKSGQLYAEEIFGDKDKYTIDFFYNNEWIGNSNFQKFNTKIEGYDVVIIVQLISKNLLSYIKCKNIVFIPMYDHSRNWGMNEWSLCQNLKILSPSKGIFDILKKYGLNSFRIKIYPEAEKYQNQDFSKVFFWNRVQTIEYSTVLKIFENYKFKNLNIHKKFDPNHKPKMPSKIELKTYNITFSEWFEKKSDYLKYLDNFGFYIAPRPFEGDGAAFIDSMKKGKIVIAPDNYPYTDYITNNINGFLYNLSNPIPINFGKFNLNEISKMAHTSILIGRNQWKDSISAIHEYIFSNKFAGNNYYFKIKKQINLLKKNNLHLR